MTELGQLVHIRSGYTFRSPPEHASDGEVRALQMRDVSLDNGINHETMVRFHWDTQSTPSFVRPGNVLVLSRAQRSSHFYAVVVPAGLEKVVASNHFYILEIKRQAVIPEYLAWYLNSPMAQKYFVSMAAGTVIPHLSRSILETLPVEIPDYITQTQIVDMDQLFRREEELTRQLLEKRKTLREAILTQLLTERIKP